MKITDNWTCGSFWRVWKLIAAYHTLNPMQLFICVLCKILYNIPVSMYFSELCELKSRDCMNPDF